MNDPIVKKIVAGAVAGLVTAIGVDIHAWQNDGYAFSFAKTFDFHVAIQRWVGGAIAGAFVGAGLSTAS